MSNKDNFSIYLKNYFLKSVALILATTLCLASCISIEKEIIHKLDEFPDADSKLIYEYIGTTGGATGDCIGLFTDRWYGTLLSAEEINEQYTIYLQENGWEIWPDEVVEIWSQEVDEGLYRFGINIFPDSNSFAQERGSYRLPDHVIQEAREYSIVYHTTMIFMTQKSANRCFGDWILD